MTIKHFAYSTVAGRIEANLGIRLLMQIQCNTLDKTSSNEKLVKRPKWLLFTLSQAIVNVQRKNEDTDQPRCQ